MATKKKSAAKPKAAKAAKPKAEPGPPLHELRSRMEAAWANLEHQRLRLRAASTYDNELIRGEKVAACLADVEEALRSWQSAVSEFEQARAKARSR